MKAVGATGATSTMIGIASAQETYPEVTDFGPFSGDKIEPLSTGSAKHPEQDRIAFASPFLTDSFEMFIAEGVSSTMDSPDAIYQISSDTVTVAGKPEWKFEDPWLGDPYYQLRFTKDLQRFAIQVPRSYEVLEPELIDIAISLSEVEDYV